MTSGGDVAAAAPRRSLRSRVTQLVVVLIAGMALMHGGLSLWLSTRALGRQLDLKATLVARSLAADSEVKLGASAGNIELLRRPLEHALAGDTEIVAIAVVEDPARVLTLVARRPDDGALAKQAATGFFLGAANGAAPLGVDRPSAAPSDDLGLLDPGKDTPIEAPRTQRLLVALSRDELRAGTFQHASVTLGVGAAAVIVALLLVGRVFRSMFARMGRVTAGSETLAQGDLRIPVSDDTDDEIGAVARSVETIRARWSSVLGEIHGVADGVVSSSERIRGEVATVAIGSETQAEAAATTAARSENIAHDSRALDAVVRRMAQICDDTSLALIRAKDSSNSVSTEMVRMLDSLQQNDAQRVELARTIVAIGSAVQALSRAVEGVRQPADDVVRLVGDASGGAARVASLAQAAASRSGEALALLSAQRNAADAVARGAQETAHVTQSLRDTMGAVLDTTALIRDIADMTGMLSLNASIIAAQAGDRALGFATVAEEIRTLATRTRNAVDGIEKRTGEARRQIALMDNVVVDLTATVDASRAGSDNATHVISDVLAQMKTALSDVAGIAEMLTSAAAGTESARAAVVILAGELKTIEGALDRQRTAQTRLDSASAAMRADAGSVRDTSEQQVESTDALIRGVTALTQATTELVRTSAAQAQSAGAIAEETARVQLITEEHKATVAAIGEALSRLDGDARALRESLSTFRRA